MTPKRRPDIALMMLAMMLMLYVVPSMGPSLCNLRFSWILLMLLMIGSSPGDIWVAG